MNKIAVLVASLFLCFFSSQAVSQVKKPAGPQIAFEERTFDFKEVDEGTTIEHTFKVFNRGNQALVIQRVDAG